MFETNVTPLNAFGSFSQGFNSASEASARQQQLDYQKQLFQMEQQKFQQQTAQKQQLMAAGQRALNGSPQDIAMVSLLDPAAGKQLLDAHKQSVDDTTNSLRAFKDKVNVNDKPMMWQTIAPQLQQAMEIKGLDGSKLPAEYSKEVDPMIDYFINAGTDLKDKYHSVETSQGIGAFDTATGKIVPTGYGNKPVVNEAAGGGATGAIVRRMMQDNPGTSFTQNLQQYQTGFRQGTQIDPSGNVTAEPGYIKSQQDIKGATKLADKLGETQATQLADLADKATQATQSIQTNKVALDLLNKGVITGTGANFKLNTGKALQAAGIHIADDPIANTEAFVANAAQSVAANIKAFGSGTGLSDADREYTQDMVGGRISLNDKSIRKILEIRNQQNQYIINQYSGRRKNLGENLRTYLPDVEKEGASQQSSKSNIISWGDLK